MILLQSLETVRPAPLLPGVPTQSFILRGASPKVREHGRTTPIAYELASDTHYGLGVVTRQAGPHPCLHSSGSFLQVLREPTEWNKANATQRGRSAVDTGHPAVITELEEARRMLSTSRTQLALRILDCTFGGHHDGIHVFCEERACEVSPEPVALVWFLFVAIQFAGHLAKLPSHHAGHVQRQRCTASTGVLNTSTSLRAVHASPSSITILPDMVDLLLSTRHCFVLPMG